jgi:hypothetical protein
MADVVIGLVEKCNIKVTRDVATQATLNDGCREQKIAISVRLLGKLLVKIHPKPR